MESIDKQELAFQYVHGFLDAEAKMQVFRLILTDQEFKQHLRDELQLVQSMRQFRHSLEGARKEEWLKRIKAKAVRQEGTELRISFWVDWALKMTMPALAYHTFNQIQRRGLS